MIAPITSLAVINAAGLYGRLVEAHVGVMVAAWEAFYNGPTYQGLKAVRDACSSARLVAVEGVA